jgi:hypothetical protein
MKSKSKTAEIHHPISHAPIKTNSSAFSPLPSRMNLKSKQTTCLIFSKWKFSVYNNFEAEKDDQYKIFLPSFGYYESNPSTNVFGQSQ